MRSTVMAAFVADRVSTLTSPVHRTQQVTWLSSQYVVTIFIATVCVCVIAAMRLTCWSMRCLMSRHQLLTMAAAIRPTSLTGRLATVTSRETCDRPLQFTQSVHAQIQRCKCRLGFTPYSPLFELELPVTLRSAIGASSDAVFT